jgi:hypothetical protein
LKPHFKTRLWGKHSTFGAGNLIPPNFGDPSWQAPAAASVQIVMYSTFVSFVYGSGRLTRRRRLGVALPHRFLFDTTDAKSGLKLVCIAAIPRPFIVRMPPRGNRFPLLGKKGNKFHFQQSKCQCFQLKVWNIYCSPNQHHKLTCPTASVIYVGAMGETLKFEKGETPYA